MIRRVLLTRFRLKNYRSKHHGSKLTRNFDRYIPGRFQSLWHHEAGPQTVFFWAPLFKWGLVFAGLADLRRDPSKISKAQTMSLIFTGLVWARYSTVIIPRNYFLLSVNVFVFVTQTYQMYRILTYKVVT